VTPEGPAPESVNRRGSLIHVLGHAHPLSTTTGRNWICDGCRVEPPAGTPASTCMACNFDLCNRCAYGLGFPAASAMDVYRSRKAAGGAFPVDVWSLFDPARYLPSELLVFSPNLTHVVLSAAKSSYQLGWSSLASTPSF
jgi:hypothetical protein